MVVITVAMMSSFLFLPFFHLKGMYFVPYTADFLMYTETHWGSSLRVIHRNLVEYYSMLSDMIIKNSYLRKTEQKHLTWKEIRKQESRVFGETKQQKLRGRNGSASRRENY